MEMDIKYVLCTSAGVAIGYYVAQSRLERRFNERLEREVDEARDFYRRKYVKKAKEEGEDEGLTKAAIETAEALTESLGYSVTPSMLTQEMTATVKRAAERGDLDTVLQETLPDPVAEDSVTNETEAPAEKTPEPTKVETPPIKVRGLVRESKKPPVMNYNRISTPDKTEAKAEADKTEAKAEADKAEAKAEADKAEAKAAEKSEGESGIEVEAITKQAFIDDQFGYEQFSFTYFAGDDVLANEDDEPVKGAARESSVGADALAKLKVGREALDGENTIFVRNHTEHWEFEVTRSDGNFSDEVDAKSG